VGDAPLSLTEDELRQISDYMRPHLRELVLEMVPPQRPAGIDAQLLERMVRVEEELKTQRELMVERFGFVEKRFESVEKRFESVDKRFESVDKRFEDVQASFGRTQWLMGLGFVMVTAAVTVFGLLA